MMKPSFLRLACAVVLLVAGKVSAQYGYVPQSIPGAGAGVAPAPATGSLMDPNLGMGGGSAYAMPNYGAPAYGGQQMYGAMTGATGSSLLTYGQLEVSYSRTTFEDKAIKATNGVQIGLMAELFKPFFIHADFSWGASSASSSTKFDFSKVTIGGGGYIPFSPRFHLVGEVGGIYSSLSASKSSLSFSDGALYINPYLRFAAADDFELRAGVVATSADNYDSRIVTLGAYYRLFSQMDVGLNAGFGDATNTYDLGIRFRW
jgi:hypothetical protein